MYVKNTQNMFLCVGARAIASIGFFDGQLIAKFVSSIGFFDGQVIA